MKELDWEESKVLIPWQLVVQRESVIHRSLRNVISDVSEKVGNRTYDDPVSRMTLYETGGVPIATVP